MYFPVCLWIVAAAIVLSAFGPIRLFHRSHPRVGERRSSGIDRRSAVYSAMPMLVAIVAASLLFVIVSPLRDGVDLDIATLFFAAACALVIGEVCGRRLWESVPRMLPRMATVAAEIGCAGLCIGAMVVGTGRWHVAELHRAQATSVAGMQGWFLFSVPAAPWLLVLMVMLVAMRARVCQRSSDVAGGLLPSLLSWGYCAVMSGVVTLLFLGGWCGFDGDGADSVFSRSVGMILFLGKMWAFFGSAVVVAKVLPIPGPRGWGEVDRRLILGAATVGFVVSCAIGPLTDDWGAAVAALSAFVCALTVLFVARGIVAARGPRSVQARVVRMNPVI